VSRILLVDDETDFRSAVAEALRDAGHDVREEGTADQGAALLRKEAFDVLVTDLRMPGGTGIDLLREATTRMPDGILVVMTAFGSLDTAIEALRLGAHDYLLKPIRLEVLLHKLSLLVRHQEALAENRFLRGALESVSSPTGLVGKSPALLQLHRLIAKVAPTDSTVLVTGETGTGKELVARAIHQQSPRAEKPFIAINCGSIPETLLESELFGHVKGAFTGADRDKRGLFEVAGAGTIFLDEIGEMPPSLQPKVLRVLEAREILRVGSTSPIRISARIVAATHRDLQKMIAEGKFREDLYYRLNVFRIPIVPLRDRPEDVGPIADSILERLARRLNRAVPALEPEARLALERHRWPGNVRELANLLERALILEEGGRIRRADLEGLIPDGQPGADDDLKRSRTHFERSHIRQVLARCGGDKRRAAEILGIDLSSLYRKLEE
jgi:DNA-binding NtrC family response regulator